MPRIGIIVGSLAKNSINKQVAKALVGLAPADAELDDLDFSELPLYSYDYDARLPRRWPGLEVRRSRASTASSS